MLSVALRCGSTEAWVWAQGELEQESGAWPCSPSLVSQALLASTRSPALVSAQCGHTQLRTKGLRNIISPLQATLSLRKGGWGPSSMVFFLWESFLQVLSSLTLKRVLSQEDWLNVTNLKRGNCSHMHGLWKHYVKTIHIRPGHH